MTGLLEFREKIKLLYSRNEVFILPVIKFLLAFVTLSMVNDRMGYMTQLDNMAIVLIVALLCSFMPSGLIAVFGALFSLLHMYALSMEVALVGLVVYLLLFLLFMRFVSKDSITIVLTPLLSGLQLPYVMPVVMGLVGTPASAVSVVCGVVVYYLFQVITTNASTISTMAADDTTAKLQMIVDGMLNNKGMLVMAAAFAATVIIVYLIRRMSVDYSWTIAIAAGVMADLVILLIGDLLYDTNLSVVNAIIGAVITILVAKIIEFFRFCVDYSRTEKVQFEDDEYYYYVKAVPKMTVAAPTKTVKRINTQRKSTPVSGADERNRRSVVTERTSFERRGTAANRAGDYRREYMNSGRSVTINGNQTADDDSMEFEDL